MYHKAGCAARFWSRAAICR